LLRLRLVNECFVLNNTDMAAIMAKKWPRDYKNIKDSLPQWGLFFVIAGYEYFPQEMVNYQIDEMKDIAQKAGLEPADAIGNVSAYEMLKIVKQPSEEPYWKLRSKGGCSDIFFLANYDRMPELIATMKAMADEADYPASEMGIYLQPIVQGVNCHCEFNLFYNIENQAEAARIKELSRRAVMALMCKGAFFSRPYGENTDIIMNRDAATVASLKKVKSIFDPNNIMNPGKLCF
jgi:FAD/FMN-containing dehydrogenase